jgi:hypothetical protein
MSRRDAGDGDASRPLRWATFAISLALRALPRGDLRDRYERELLTELHAMPRGRQGRYALGVLGTAWSLRRAVQGSNALPEETNMADRKPLLCRFNIKHHWIWHYTDPHERYLVCSRCGKDGPGTTAQAANGAVISGIMNGGLGGSQ